MGVYLLRRDRCVHILFTNVWIRLLLDQTGVSYIQMLLLLMVVLHVRIIARSS